MKIRFEIVFGFAFLLALAIGAGCSSERRETTTYGKVDIYVDNEIYPVMQKEEEKFEALYPDAKVNLLPASSREAVVQFLNVDTTKVIALFRPMNAEEKAVLDRAEMKMQEHKVTLSAVAIIVHPTNPIDSFRTTQLDSIFSGKLTKWSELGWKNNSVPIGVSIPDQNSGVFEVVARKVLRGEKFGTVANIASTPCHFERSQSGVEKSALIH